MLDIHSQFNLSEIQYFWIPRRFLLRGVVLIVYQGGCGKNRKKHF